jgi:hypothetical protein
MVRLAVFLYNHQTNDNTCVSDTHVQFPKIRNKGSVFAPTATLWLSSDHVRGFPSYCFSIDQQKW